MDATRRMAGFFITVKYVSSFLTRLRGDTIFRFPKEKRHEVSAQQR